MFGDIPKCYRSKPQEADNALNELLKSENLTQLDQKIIDLYLKKEEMY